VLYDFNKTTGVFITEIKACKGDINVSAEAAIIIIINTAAGLPLSGISTGIEEAVTINKFRDR
jgi:hypothetical protein